MTIKRVDLSLLMPTNKLFLSIKEWGLNSYQIMTKRTVPD